LRNDNNEHLYSLDGDDVEVFKWLAKEGEVEEFTIRKKGRDILVFRLKSKDSSLNLESFRRSACDLTVNDTKALAGCNGTPNRFQIERWIGYGLIPSR